MTPAADQPDTVTMPGKAELRARAQQRRAALGAAYRTHASARIAFRCLMHPAVADAQTVFVYVATGEEVATRSLIDDFVATGRTVLVPRLANRTLMHAVPFPGWSAMRPGSLGILSPPPEPAPWLQPVDTVLAPGLAFTTAGVRLGYGAGYYDRWIADHHPRRVLALAFAVQVVDWLPESAHDRRVDALVTERTAEAFPAAPPGDTLERR